MLSASDAYVSSGLLRWKLVLAPGGTMMVPFQQVLQHGKAPASGEFLKRRILSWKSSIGA